MAVTAFPIDSSNLICARTSARLWVQGFRAILLALQSLLAFHFASNGNDNLGINASAEMLGTTSQPVANVNRQTRFQPNSAVFNERH
jgi:hypothetical protein